MSLVAPARAEAENRDDEAFELGFLGVNVASATTPDGQDLLDTGLQGGVSRRRYNASVMLGFGEAPLPTGARIANTVTLALGKRIGWSSRHAALLFYGEARVSAQARYGASLSPTFGVAVAGDVGAQGVVCGRESDNILYDWCVALSWGARYQLHLSDYQVDKAVLPRGSQSLSPSVMLALGRKL